ncbi:TPA: hypothetical protein SIF59_004268 [Escherichia coli]|nr:hypothetical protein [Escherichia coli]
MLPKLKVIIASIVAFAAMLLTAWLSGRSSGKQVAKEEVQKDNLNVAKEQIHESKVVNKIDVGVKRSDDSAVDSELSNDWTRD